MAQKVTATWQFSTLPAVPVYCRALIAERSRYPMADRGRSRRYARMLAHDGMAAWGHRAG